MRAILTWHSIDPSGSPISVSSEAFRRQIEWLARSGVRVVTVPELLTLDEHANAAALTFDDGFLNFNTDALPLLLAHGFAATLFVVTGHVGGDNRWRGRTDAGIPVLPLLDWDDLGRMRAAGVTIAAHTHTHAHLTRHDDEQVLAEFTEASAELERRLGERPGGFAYPYGEVDARIATLAATHYQWACTTEYRPLAARDHALLLPRLDAQYLTDPAALARWGTPHFRATVWVRRQARRVRATLLPRTSA